MSTLKPTRLPPRLHTLAALAGLLDRLEREPGSASAGQYRRVAAEIAKLLAGAAGDEQLPALLDLAPATSEIYENLHYGVAGLCRSPLEASLNAELAATAAIDAARRR